MPCMGPQMPSEKEIDNCAVEVLGFLRYKGILNSDYATLPMPMQKERDHVVQAVCILVQNILEQDACEKF